MAVLHSCDVLSSMNGLVLWVYDAGDAGGQWQAAAGGNQSNGAPLLHSLQM